MAPLAVVHSHPRNQQAPPTEVKDLEVEIRGHQST
jgi:hypothetical protein